MGKYDESYNRNEPHQRKCHREKLTKDEGKSLFRKIIYDQDSIYQYLLSILEGVCKDVDPKVFVNFLRILALCQTERESLHEDVLQQNMNMIFDKMFEYVFE